MTNTNTCSIQFINHASTIISDSNICLLSDPWFFGTAFHDGWALIYENPDNEICEVLDKITHIWISHEHPDHFSIPFFNKFYSYINDKKIKILFQETKDKRVIGFLKSKKLDVNELTNKKTYHLSDTFFVKCVKSGFYDSALLMNVAQKKIFNINDCPIRDEHSIQKFKKDHGGCDILLTQFSYAAWKGGVENIEWRKDAASEKINTLISQANIFSAKIVVPFASFVRFSNMFNSYLNDSINTPEYLTKVLKNKIFKTVLFKPMEQQYLHNMAQNQDSVTFWKSRYQNLTNEKLIGYGDSILLTELEQLYEKYRNRVLSKNSYWIIFILSKLKLFGFFQKINILIQDTNQIVSLDILQRNIEISNENADLLMHSQSLKFILSNSFGFDTLTVNGCFKEIKQGSFIRVSKALAIENLNNMGIYLTPSLFFRFDLIILFMSLVLRVSKKLNHSALKSPEV